MADAMKHRLKELSGLVEWISNHGFLSETLLTVRGNLLSLLKMDLEEVDFPPSLRDEIDAVLTDGMLIDWNVESDQKQAFITRLLVISHQISHVVGLSAPQLLREQADERRWLDSERITKAVSKELHRRSAVFERGETLNESLEAGIERLRTLENALTLLRSETADAISVMQNEHRATFKALEIEAAGVLGTMQTHEKQAQTLLKYVGEQGASAGYDHHAKRSGGSRFCWQVITVVSFVAWIYWGSRAYSVMPSGELTLPMVLRSFLSAMPFALLTGFGVLQVSRFSAAEERNRRAQLEIFAMEPLLTGLDAGDQKELRKLLIPCFYRTEPGPMPPDATQSDKIHTELAQKLLDLVGKK